MTTENKPTRGKGRAPKVEARTIPACHVCATDLTTVSSQQTLYYCVNIDCPDGAANLNTAPRGWNVRPWPVTV